MIEYRITFAVGRLDKTWFEQEVTILNHDEGDRRAVAMGEAQILNSFDKTNTPVAFITFLRMEYEEEADDDIDWFDLAHRDKSMDSPDVYGDGA